MRKLVEHGGGRCLSRLVGGDRFLAQHRLQGERPGIALLIVVAETFQLRHRKGHNRIQQSIGDDQRSPLRVSLVT